ncbi:MAG: carbon-nitrogen hydrolase family protein, partial [Bacteroidales bacterium]|nr:carbon-nitrogen hydrolase family protein [Bacteroidales bacterium]
MKIAMAQMAIGEDVAENLRKSIQYIEEAAGKADFIFFPELQLTPFYPLHPLKHWGVERKELAFTFQSEEVKALRDAARKADIWVSPNLYMDDSFTNPLSGVTYPYYRDMNLVFNPEGKLVETASMVHVLGVEDFWETDYYDPSDDGFKVVETPMGRIGIVICYDRHLPESIRTCALKGAELIII